MGLRGPAGKRSEERQRTNAPDIPIEKLEVSQILQAEVTKPVADEDWHPVAQRWFDSLAESAQCIYYEPSDWAIAYLTAESMSRDMEDQVVGITEDGTAVYAPIPLKGASLSAYVKIFTALLMTEGDRRRVNLEITRASSVSMDENESGTTDIAASRAEAVGG